jgi:hypothetical protein
MNAMNTASMRIYVFSTLTRFIHPAFKSTVIGVCLICIGCTTTNYKANPSSPNLPKNARVLLMPLDVQQPAEKCACSFDAARRAAF